MVNRPVTFYFEGRPLRGIEGEPIAKALFAAGIRTLSYSVKYRRARSVHCARGRCVACHMSVNGTPGVPTCITPLESGMVVEREGYQPFYGPPASFVARHVRLPAGFYYRSFTRPAFARKLFFYTLRRLAGVGRLSSLESPRSEASGAAAQSPAASLPVGRARDVVVVGGGLSGMAAAISAAQQGANVLLVDENAFAGGHSFGYQPDGDLGAAREELIRSVSTHASIRYLPGVIAQAFYPPDTLLLAPARPGSFREIGGSPETAAPRVGMTCIRAGAFVFATGANDLIPLMENGEKPGIFGERAIRLLLERDDFRPGRRAVVYGMGAPLRVIAQLLLHHDIKLVALVDPTEGAKSDQQNRRVLDKIRTVTAARVVAARGGEWIESVEVSRDGGRERTVLECDLLCVALPGQPAYELPHQAGFEYALADAPLEESRVMLPVAVRSIPENGGPSLFVAGEAAGERDWRIKIEKGRQAGEQAGQSARR